MLTTVIGSVVSCSTTRRRFPIPAAGVDQHGAVAAEHQINDGVLVMTRLGNCEQMVEDLQNVEPIVIDWNALRSRVLKILRVIHSSRWSVPFNAESVAMPSFSQCPPEAVIAPRPKLCQQRNRFFEKVEALAR